MADIVINFPEDSEDGTIFELWVDDCLYNDDDYEDFGDEIYED